MGVSSIINRVTYNGDGTSTSFSFPYYFFKTTDIVVYVYDTIFGGTTLQTLGTNYTISGTPNSQGLYTSGANIVFGTAPLSTSNIIIFRSPAETQTYALQQNGNISSSALVQQMDYLTLLIQRLEDQVSRCITLPDGLGEPFSGVLPSTIAQSGLYYLQVNAAATGMQLAASSPNFQAILTPYTTAQTSSTVITIPLFSIPAASMLTSVVMKHTVAFSGTAISAVTASLGISGSAAKFINSFDVHQSVADQAFTNIQTNYVPSFASATEVNLTLTATGANLSALTQGNVTVFYNIVPL